MRYELFLALRHLRSRRNRRLASATSLIAVLGIAVGVASLVVVLALANGFRDEIRDKILRGTAHLTVMRSDGRSMPEYAELATRISAVPGVVSASGTTYDGAMIIGPQAAAYGVLRGVDVSSQRATSDIADSLIAGSLDPLIRQNARGDLPVVVLGAELASRIAARVGDEVETFVVQSSSSRAPRLKVRVAGIFRSGLFEYDSSWIYANLDTAAALSGGSNSASVIGVQVDDIYQVKQISARIRETLGSSYTTVDWQEANRPLFTALALERRIGLIIIALIILVAALNVTTTLILVVMERRREIAILNAMGATRTSIMIIFVIEGAIVGAVAALVGVLLGAATTYIANRYQLISLPPDVYSISNVPLHMYANDLMIAAVVTLLLSIIATIYPARAAAKIRPAEMLRQ